MLDEDNLPRPPAQLVAKPPLDRLGVAELRAYIAGLEDEIARAQTEISRKQAMLDSAHSFFKTP